MLTVGSIVSIQWDTHAEEPSSLWTQPKSWIVFGIEWVLGVLLVSVALTLHKHKHHAVAQRFCIPISIGLFSAQATSSISFVLRTILEDEIPWTNKYIYLYGMNATIAVSCLCTTYYYARIHPHTDAILVLVLSQAPFFAASTVNSVLVFEKPTKKYRVLVLAFVSFFCLCQHKVQNHIQHRASIGQFAKTLWKPRRSTKTVYWIRLK